MDGYIYRPMRPISRQIARWLKGTSVSPDMVTFCWFTSYIAAAACFATGQRAGSVAAAGFILLAGLLDCLDGDLARERKLPSIAGAFLEQILHWISQPLLIIGIVMGYGGELLPGWEPSLVVGLAIIADQMFHQVFFIINSAMDRRRDYGALHTITARILPLMPINSNIYWVSGLFCIPALGLGAYTIFATAAFLGVATLYYRGERCHGKAPGF